jgi:hypothetical protein
MTTTLLGQETEKRGIAMREREDGGVRKKKKVKTKNNNNNNK